MNRYRVKESGGSRIVFAPSADAAACEYARRENIRGVYSVENLAAFLEAHEDYLYLHVGTWPDVDLVYKSPNAP